MSVPVIRVSLRSLCISRGKAEALRLRLKAWDTFLECLFSQNSEPTQAHLLGIRHSKFSSINYNFTCYEIKVNWLVTQSCLALCKPMDYIAHQAPLSMGISRQDYWSRLPFYTPGDLFNTGIEPASLAFPALAGRFFTTAPPRKPMYYITFNMLVNWGFLLLFCLMSI